MISVFLLVQNWLPRFCSDHLKNEEDFFLFMCVLAFLFSERSSGRKPVKKVEKNRLKSLSFSPKSSE